MHHILTKWSQMGIPMQMHIVSYFAYNYCLFKIMEDSSSLALLPLRPKMKSALPPGAKEISLVTNIYHIEFTYQPAIHSYTIKSDPFIALEDSDWLHKRLLSSKRRELRQMVGRYTSLGATLYAISYVKSITLNISKNEDKQIYRDYQLTLTHNKQLVPNRYDQMTTWSQQQIRQVLAINKIAIKNALQKMKMTATSRNRYLEPANHQNSSCKDYLPLRCYDIRLTPIGKSLKLVVDVGFRVTGQLNCLQEIKSLKQQGISTDFLLEKRVVTLYNNRCYKLLRIRTDKTPEKEIIQKGGKSMNLLQYMKEHYNINITDQKQFLLEVVSRQYYVDKQKKEKKIETCFLVPDLCRFVKNLKEIQEQCRDRNMFKSISNAIKITPDERKRQEQCFISMFNAAEENKKEKDRICYISDEADKVKGIYFDKVNVQFRNNVPIYNGLFDEKKLQKLQEKSILKDKQWLVLFSKDQKTNPQYVVEDLVKSGTAYDVDFGMPIIKEIDNGKKLDSKIWINTLQEYVQNKAIKIVLLVFNHKRERTLYGPIKKYLTMMKIPSQVVFGQKTGSIAVSGKVMVQMAAKLGVTAWSVPTRHPFWNKKLITVGAISITRDTKMAQQKVAPNVEKKQYIVGLVGTSDKNISKGYSQVVAASEKELTDSKFYQDLFSNWIKSISVNNPLPDAIILYRDGMSQLELNNRGKAEIKGMQAVLVRAKKKKENYNPTFVCLHVVKNSNKRVYQINENGGKFRPLVNPPAGTIVFDPLSSNQVYDFHIAPIIPKNTKDRQQGTTTLTQCQVVHYQGPEQAPQQALAQLTLEQCYNLYPIWMGAVKVPGVLQGANRLTKLFGENFHESLSKDDPASERALQNKLFYL